jgi:hypothetical protein
VFESKYQIGDPEACGISGYSRRFLELLEVDLETVETREVAGFFEIFTGELASHLLRS